MNTRRVEDGERRRSNGWASAPEYVELRPFDGTAVAAKVELLASQEQRELLFFIQGLTLRKGGAKRIAQELLEMFPERLGTPTMHKIGCKPGKRLSPEQAKQIWNELKGRDSDWDPPIDIDAERVRSADDFISSCRVAAGNLDAFLEQLCCDPGLQIASADSRHSYAKVPYFNDVVSALFEYKRRHEARARAEYTMTSLGAIVFEAFDYALETGRSALIEGRSGFGKSTALDACCEMNLGKVRFIRLEGITNRTTFAQKLSDGTGVACGKAFSPARKLIRVQEFLRRTKLMLVIDEGQYLWPQGKRIVSHPELINWLNTACYNEGVPFLISATKQFTIQRQAVERQTDWSSEQARRRIRKVFPLPDVPTTDDLRSVARKLLAGFSEAAVEFVVGYALSSRGYFQTITDAIEDAQLIAKRAGRDRITGKDLQVAVKEWRAPSDAALQRVFDSKPDKQRRAGRVPEPLSGDYESPAESNEPLARGTRPLQTTARRETQPVLVPG